jgi:hypothetical protein
MPGAQSPDKAPPVHYLVGTPKGRLTFGKASIAQPWQEARPGVQVKLLPQQGELYVLAKRDRVAKERTIRRRQLKRLWARLKQPQRWKSRARTADETRRRTRSVARWRLVVIEVAADSAAFTYWFDRNKLRQARSRKAGISCAPTSSRKTPPSCGASICSGCGQEAFRPAKACLRNGGDLAIRPIFPPLRGPHRGGARLHRLPGLLPARHSCAALACAGAR